MGFLAGYATAKLLSNISITTGSSGPKAPTRSAPRVQYTHVEPTETKQQKIRRMAISGDEHARHIRRLEHKETVERTKNIREHLEKIRKLSQLKLDTIGYKTYPSIEINNRRIRLDRNDMKKSINRGVTSLNIENFKYHARCNSFHSTKTFYEIRRKYYDNGDIAIFTIDLLTDKIIAYEKIDDYDTEVQLGNDGSIYIPYHN